jgi:hypothetical protein
MDSRKSSGPLLFPSREEMRAHLVDPVNCLYDADVGPNHAENDSYSRSVIKYPERMIFLPGQKSP